MFIAIEGIDGIGKTTLSNNLYNMLKDLGYKCCQRSFPNYETTVYGQIIKMCLNGYFGSLEEIDVNFMTMLFSADRYLSCETLLVQLRNYDVVICDRYVGSNLAYGAAKILIQNTESTQSEIEKFWDQNIKIEHDIMHLPIPDLYLLLDINYEDSPGFTKEDKDILERENSYVCLVRKMYHQLAKKQLTTRWHTIELLRHNKLVNSTEVMHESQRLIQEILNPS